MILTREYWTENISELTKHPQNYMIVKTGHFPYFVDKERLEHGIEILNLCNSLSIVNDAYKDMNIQKEFEFSILYKALESIYTNKPFTDEQLQSLFEFDKKLDEFCKGMRFLASDFNENLYLSTEVKLMLLGFELKKQDEFNRLERRHQGDEYGEIIHYQYDMERKYYKGEISLQEMKKDVLQRFNDGLEKLKILDKNKKSA